MRLDQTVTRSNLAIITKGLDELSARKARLSSERDGADAMVFPDPLMSRRSGTRTSLRSWTASASFSICVRLLGQDRSQLRQQVEQLQEEIVGMTAQQRAKKREVELITHELEEIAICSRGTWSRSIV